MLDIVSDHRSVLWVVAWIRNRLQDADLDPGGVGNQKYDWHLIIRVAGAFLFPASAPTFLL